MTLWYWNPTLALERWWNWCVDFGTCINNLLGMFSSSCAFVNESLQPAEIWWCVLPVSEGYCEDYYCKIFFFFKTSWSHFVSAFNFHCPIPSFVCVEVCLCVSQREKRHQRKMQENLSWVRGQRSSLAVLLPYYSPVVQGVLKWVCQRFSYPI